MPPLTAGVLQAGGSSLVPSECAVKKTQAASTSALTTTDWELPDSPDLSLFGHTARAAVIRLHEQLGRAQMDEELAKHVVEKTLASLKEQYRKAYALQQSHGSQAASNGNGVGKR